MGISSREGMAKKRVLLMGVSGFLGSQLFRRLKGDDTIDLYAPSHKVLDAASFGMLHEYLEENRIQIVIHAVANHAGVGTGVNKELYFLESNLLMNTNLVKASYECGVEKFITFGTSCCYNDPDQIIFTESDYWKNKSEISYGTCKRVMLEHLQRQNNMNWVYLVPPNLYGPGDHFGEKNTHFIPATYKKFEDAVKNGKKSIVVWGDGFQMRDFLYVEDLVEIVIRAIRTNMLDKEVINVATMSDCNIREVVSLIQKNLGYEDIVIEWDTSKPTGVKRKILDNSKLLKRLPGFKFTDISTGINLLTNWYLKMDAGRRA